jgi:hypothetical protein
MADDPRIDAEDDEVDAEQQGGDEATLEREGGEVQHETKPPPVDVSGLERAGREAEEKGIGVTIEETFPARP